MTFAEPLETIAANMPASDALQVWKSLKQQYKRVNMKEHPTGFFTLEAHDRRPEIHIVDKQARK